MSRFNINRLLQRFLSNYKRLNSYDDVIQTCHNGNEYLVIALAGTLSDVT